jgi:hypothetical protein
MKNAIKVFLMVAGVTVCANLAKAQSELTIYDGVNPLITVLDNGAGDQNASAGSIYVSTNVGVWTLTITSALTKPSVGSAINPIMDIVVQAVSSAGGTLRYTFSDNNYLFTPGTWNTGLSGVLNGVGVAYGVFGDPANVVGAQTISVAAIGTSPLPANNSGVFNLTAPYSLTQLVELAATGATSLNVDASFTVTPVPEPNYTAMVVLALAAVGVARRKSAKA